MNTPIIMFRILFFLGCAPELEIKNFNPVVQSKHYYNRTRSRWFERGIHPQSLAP